MIINSRNKRQADHSSGFTLIELLVVIVIVGLLASIVLVSLNSARQKSRDARRKADMRQLTTAINLYLNDFGAYPVGEDDTAGAGFGVDYSNVDASQGYIPGSRFIPELISNGYMSRSANDPGGGGAGAVTGYWYAHRNSNFMNKTFRYMTCGGPAPPPADPPAQAVLIFWLEGGSSPDYSPGLDSNSNSVCFNY